MTVLQDKFDIAIDVMENRLTSASKGTDDISVKMRLIEYESILNRIEELPFGGNGLAADFRVYNPLTFITEREIFTHNGYFYLAFRLGIPFAVFFIFPFVYYLIRAERFSRRIKSEFYKSVSISALTSFLLLFITNFVTTSFQQRDAIFVIIITFALTGIAEQQFLKELKEKYGKKILNR